MRIKKYLLILLTILCLTGCTSKLEDSTNKLSKLIIELHNNKEVDSKNLNNEEKELLNSFINKEKEENKEVNLSKILPLSEESYTENNDTYGVYKKGSDYYIKYKDIIWNNVNGTYLSIIDIDNKEDALYKEQIPILYKDTHDNDKYYFRRVYIDIKKDKITHTYKSLKDESGLIIEYTISDNKIDNIELTYKNIIDIKEEKKKISIGIIIYPILIGGMIFIVFNIYKKNA